MKLKYFKVFKIQGNLVEILNVLKKFENCIDDTGPFFVKTAKV
jgi:hypothetical protein